ncbi:MAG: hypothetical protein ABW007_19130 [Chitinophagaceae bacterium]
MKGNELSFELDVTAGELARMRRLYGIMQGPGIPIVDNYAIDAFDMENRASIYACLAEVAYSRNDQEYVDFESEEDVDITDPIFALLENLGYVVLHMPPMNTVRVSFQAALHREQHRGYSNYDTEAQLLAEMLEQRAIESIGLSSLKDLNTPEKIDAYAKAIDSYSISIPYYDELQKREKEEAEARHRKNMEKMARKKLKRIEELNEKAKSTTL